MRFYAKYAICIDLKNVSVKIIFDHIIYLFLKKYIIDIDITCFIKFRILIKINRKDKKIVIPTLLVAAIFLK